MTAIEEMNQAFRMMLDPSYAEKSAEERAKIREISKVKIISAETRYNKIKNQRNRA